MVIEPRVVAEIGCAHLGQMDRAKKLIKLAKNAGANYAKFQKRNPEECVPKELQNQPHPNARFAYGPTYLEHRKALELTVEEHKRLRGYCDAHNIRYTTSVWDMTSAREIVALGPCIIKVGSPTNTNFDLIRYLLDEFWGQVHISLGMTSYTEINAILNLIAKSNVDWSRIVLYHCTSEYPCPFEHLYLNQIRWIRSILPPEAQVGFSNHGYGIAADIAALTLGATWFERHFVDDRTLPHTDAAASLEPDGLRRLCRDLRAVAKALESDSKPGVTPEEEIQRKKLKYSQQDVG